MKSQIILALGILCLGTAATAEESKPAAKAAPAAAAEPAAAPAADGKKINWEAMSKAERKKYMKTTVLPAAKKLFVEFDAKHYKNFNCQTCHGKKAEEVKFKMPSEELPELPAPTDREGFQALAAKKPEAAKFMGTKVKPAMASLLGLAEWTPENTKGFGCYGCHTAVAAK